MGAAGQADGVGDDAGGEEFRFRGGRHDDNVHTLRFPVFCLRVFSPRPHQG